MWVKKKQDRAIDFVEKYTPLMTRGETKQFGVKEKPKDLEEALNTKDASVLMTKVIEDTMQMAAEPMYIGTKIFKTINTDNANRIIFPAIGALRAHEIPEGSNYPNESLDIMKKEKNTEVTTSKKGLMVPITEEMIQDSQWEIKKIA